MSNQKSNSSRRKLLKAIATGSGAVVAGKSLPESWSKPVINAIVLPAHAAMTDDTGLLGGGTAVTTLSPACCEGVFCGIQFSKRKTRYAAVQVNRDCSITMQVNDGYGNWSGSGTVAADGSFSFSASYNGGNTRFIIPTTTPGPVTTMAPPSPRQFSGTVAANCASISGTAEVFGSFATALTPGATSLADCQK